MSLNTSTTPDGRGVLLYTGEVILLYTKSVVMSFDTKNGEAFKGKKDGALYLTSHRIIFVNEKNGQSFKSFAMPFFNLQDVKLEQPIMGSNYLKGFVQALPDGNFVGEIKWRLNFPKGGCIDFGRALLLAVDMASRQRAQSAPPMYYPTAPAYAAAPATIYAAPSNNYYGFVAPTNVFPDRPPVGDVYVYDKPPPYPGIAPVPQYENVPENPPYAPPYNPGYAPAAGPSGYPTAYPGQLPSYSAAPPPPQSALPPYPGYAEAPPLPQKQ